MGRRATHIYMCVCVHAWQHSAGRKTGSTAVGSRNSGADQSSGGWHYGRSAIVYSPATSPFWQGRESMCACVCRQKSLKIQSSEDRVWVREDTRCVCVCLCTVSWQTNMGLSSVSFGSCTFQAHINMHIFTHTQTKTLPTVHVATKTHCVL